MSEKDGGPTFPCEPRMWRMSLDDQTPEPAPGYHNGMTLRDWFAGQCMSEMILLAQDGDGGWCTDNVARGCYNLADAMLRARGET